MRSEADGQRLSPHEIGALGERLAASFLRQEKFRILYRNYRAPAGGEVDIVARDGDTLVFVEVKTRTSEDYGRPISAVDEEKRGLIARGALDWHRRLGHPPEILRRFDVVEVLLRDGEFPSINRVENAFQLARKYHW